MFHNGDLIWILSYDQVQDHYCIHKDYWDFVYKNNPHIVQKSSIRWFNINGYGYSWPNYCAKTEQQIISVPDIMSMI